MGKNEYLVSGAQLKCTSGSEPGWLKIPVGHGYTSGGKNKANCEDCVEKDNIPYFGKCSRNHGTHKCEGFMKLSDKWESMSPSLMSAEKVNGADAIDMQSVLICKKGGLIMPVTSGQGYQKGVDLKKFAKKFQKTIPWTLGKSFICHILGRDPVNLNTGNYIYEKESLAIPGVVGLSFRLMYNSMSSERDGGMAEGWTHNYGLRIREMEGGFLYLRLDDGRSLPYRRTVGGMYTPVFGDRGIVRKDRDGFLYCTPDNTEYTFDGRGLLLTRKDRNGNTDSFFHNAGGQLMKVSGACGGEFTYTYNREGNLIRVEDHTGRMVRLRYRYGRLWQFVNESGHTYTYGYNEDGRLESIVTPRGITGVYNEYDAANRVVKQVLPDGGVAEMMYDDENMRSYVKNPDGSMVIHEMDERMRNVKNIYADGEETFGYNDNNQRTFYVDKNGNKTKYRYDGRGNLAAVTNALGQVTEYTYDSGNRLLTVKECGKIISRNAYDEEGRLVKSTDALGRSRRIVYNGKGLPEQLEREDGSLLYVRYDDRGNIIGTTDSNGVATAYTYDILNRLVMSADAEGNAVCYEYDAESRVTAVINPEGNTRTYTYNESGEPVCIRDFDGNEVTVEYDCMNRPGKITDKEGGITLRRYDLMGNLAEEISPSGAVTIYTYDRNGHMVKTELRKTGEEAESSFSCIYEYDPVGNVLHGRVLDGGKVTAEVSHVYDVLDRVIQTVDPVGNRTEFSYGSNGQISSITDPAGNRRSYSYNDAGELTRMTDIHGNVTVYTRNMLGQVTSVTDGAGRSSRYDYLPGGRLETVIYPDGRKIRYDYDAMGRVTARTAGNGLCWTYRYDSMGRIHAITGNNGLIKGYAYDAVGNTTSVTDANGNTTCYEYSPNGNLTAVTDALGNRTEYIHDVSGFLTGIRQCGKKGETDRETVYGRNSLGQTEYIRDALGREEHFHYDVLGRMAWKTDREGYRTEYDYRPDGRLGGIVYGDGSRVELEYTPLGQIALVRDWNGETKIERNRQGRPVRVTDHTGKTVEYEWGAMGEKKSMTYPDGKKIRYGYDGQLRLEKLVREERGKTDLCITYRYDGEGRLSEKNAGGLCTVWQYNAVGLPEELIHRDGRDILDRYRYEYDAVGNKTGIKKERKGLPGENGTYGFLYDPLNRLTDVEKDGKPIRKYIYDSFGNRTGMMDYSAGRTYIYTYDMLNQLTGEEIWEGDVACTWSGGIQREADMIKTYAYDLRGNLISECTGGTQSRRYVYNAGNRLSEFRDSKGMQSLYCYNGLGYRTAKVSGDRKETYFLDLMAPGGRLLEFQRGEERQNIYWDLSPAAVEDTGKSPRYYMNDELGSPLRVLYATGRGSAYGYDEFGNDLHDMHGADSFGTPYAKQGEEQPFGYTGYRYDGDSGTYFAQAREYDAGRGRFSV